MTFEVQVAHGVEEVGQAAWDRLGGERPFGSFRWYRYGEAVLADDLPVYVVLSRRGEPVARATFWLRRREQLPVPSRLVRWLLEAALRRWPLMTCQAPLVGAGGLILPRDPALRDGALDVITRVAGEQAREHAASFLVFDYLEEDEAGLAGWREGFATAEVQGQATVLPIRWPDVESYLESLAKPGRAEYRRNGRHAAEMGIEVACQRLAAPLDDATLDEAVAQVWSVDRRHKSAPTPWARGMLAHAGMVDSTWVRAEQDGRMAGCIIVVGDRGVRKMTLVGHRQAVRYAYFQLIYAAIRCAIEEQDRVLWGGSGVYKMKRELGFRLAGGNHTVFAGVGRLAHALGRAVARVQGDGNR